MKTQRSDQWRETRNRFCTRESRSRPRFLPRDLFLESSYNVNDTRARREIRPGEAGLRVDPFPGRRTSFSRPTRRVSAYIERGLPATTAKRCGHAQLPLMEPRTRAAVIEKWSRASIKHSLHRGAILLIRWMRSREKIAGDSRLSPSLSILSLPPVPSGCSRDGRLRASQFRSDVIRAHYDAVDCERLQGRLRLVI